MKRTYIAVLGLSVVANIALLAALASKVPDAEPAAAAAPDGNAEGPSVSGSAAAQEGRGDNAGGTTSPLAAAAQTKAIVLNNWASLYSTDVRKFVANLRAAGLSERMVFTIVDALMFQENMTKRREIALAVANEPYWKSRGGLFANPEAAAKYRKVMNDYRATMRELFGSTALNPNDRDIYQQRYGPLSDEKLLSLTQLNSDYGELMSQASIGGPTMPWEREERARFEKAKRKDIEALLSPSELELFDLYASSTATSMRRELAGFNASEAEFRQLFQLRKAFDDQYSFTVTMGSPDLMTQRMTAQRQLTEQIRSTLGEARYADYQRSTDTGYRTASNIAQRLNLPPENAEAVYALQKDMQLRLAAMRSQPTENRTDATSALAKEASAKLSTLLTPQGAEAYKARAGTWLRVLERPPTTRQTAPKG